MTLTTVGDDRKYPTTNFGQFIAGCCAVMGTFIVTLPIPIVVNSFARNYNNQLWRSEVSQRRMMIINETKRRRMIEKGMRGLLDKYDVFSDIVAKTDIVTKKSTAGKSFNHKC